MKTYHYFYLESIIRSAWSMAAAVTLISTSSSLCTRGASRSLLTERQEAERERQSRGEEGEEGAGFELQEKNQKSNSSERIRSLMKDREAQKSLTPKSHSSRKHRINKENKKGNK